MSLTPEERNDKYNKIVNEFHDDLHKSIIKSIKKVKVKFKKGGFNRQETIRAIYDVFRSVTENIDC